MYVNRDGTDLAKHDASVEHHYISQLLSISHPNKYLSLISVLTPESLSHGLLKRTFQEYGVKLPITEKVRASIKSKLWRMGQVTQGRNWKCGRDSVMVNKGRKMSS